MMSYNLMLNSVTSILIIFVSCFLVKLIWKNRNLYYYTSKIPGPFAWPLIGNIYIFSGGLKDFYKALLELIKKYPPIFKFWLGPHVMIVNTVPEDIEIILSTFLDKSNLYEYGRDFLGNGLITAPLSVWKKHRKFINPSFNTKILTSFVKIFSKHSKKLMENLKNCGAEDDLIPVFWNCTLSVACEAFTDTDPSQITGLDEYISRIVRVEKLISVRFFNILYASDTLWKWSNLYKEMQVHCSQMFNFVNNVIETRKLNKLKTTDEMRSKRFLNHLLDLNENNNSITNEDILEETHTILTGGSETSAVVIASILLVLSIHKDTQDKAYEELYSIFGNSERDATLEDINRMEYLERVIKEVMRLFPVVPLIVRRADKDTKINSVVYPEGSNILVHIAWLLRNPEYWRDSLKFDPDRFLHEKSEQRHHCTYIPFSYGSRNCIGLKYGMLAIKVILSTILRYYEVSSTKYKSIFDIEMYFHIIAKPKGGCRVVLTRRKSEVFENSKESG